MTRALAAELGAWFALAACLMALGRLIDGRGGDA